VPYLNATKAKKNTAFPSANIVAAFAQNFTAEQARDLMPKGAGGRPGFNVASKRHARDAAQRGDYPKITHDSNLRDHNLAMPHRMSFFDIRANTTAFHQEKEGATAFLRWTKRFIDAGDEKIKQLDKSPFDCTNAKQSQHAFTVARDQFAKDPKNADLFSAFIAEANQFHANVPDLGPHFGVNNVVGERAHFHVVQGTHGRTLSPMSRRVASMSPGRLSGYAVDSSHRLISTDGSVHDADQFEQSVLVALSRHSASVVNKFNPKFITK
jgi:hypothetical protein